MSLWQAFVDGIRRGYTQGPTVISIARVALAQRSSDLEVELDLRIDNWHGDPVQIGIEIVDAETHVRLVMVDYQARPDWPCWNVTIPNITYRVTAVPGVRCYARVTLREHGEVLTSSTSAPIEAARRAKAGANASRGDRDEPHEPHGTREAGARASARRARVRRTPRAPGTVASPEEKLLGLVPGYDAAVLKAAYRRAIRRWHPDRFATSSQTRRDAATERTRRVIAAYATLAERLAAGYPRG
jgi:hypothetical protein